MTRRTKTMILSICLVAALMLTACQTHVDNDPWPASDGVTATDVPETTVDQSTTQESVQAQPTEVPEPEGEPGLNG
ncbi:MAG: hypothetical protein MR742_07370 [Clostridiales bacterium]|nr:hypothetical protein [Clostridiales bacterium]MDY2655581.1 hypothetical protein [Candidatus Limiplasma sp.]